VTRDEMQQFRAQELLLQRATDGLDPSEAAELAALGAEDDASYDLAAAAIDVATLRVIEPLPAHVAQRVLAGAPAPALPMTWPGIAPQRPSGIPSTLAGVAPPRPIGVPIAAEPAPVIAEPPAPDEVAAARAKKRSRAPLIAAYVVAAACVALAIGAVLWSRQQQPVAQTTPSPSEGRAQLLASANDVVTLPWTPTTDAAAQGASGDIVWSPSRQEGYMRFVGLQINDPALVQYQLWIFDRDRDQAFPVDGGVFDITPAGEVIVPIRPKLRVGAATLFAVTVEKPGGVVVSKRERIVVTAKPG
jgi:hypothetical protein